VLPAEVLEKIEAIVRLPSTEQRLAKRGQAVLLMAAAVGTSDIAMLVGVNERTVRKGKKRFACESPMDKHPDGACHARASSIRVQAARRADAHGCVGCPARKGLRNMDLGGADW
jgi:hypothetical protein